MPDHIFVINKRNVENKKNFLYLANTSTRAVMVIKFCDFFHRYSKGVSEFNVNFTSIFDTVFK